MATVATQLNSGSGFASGEIVTATKLNNLVNTATVTGIQTADISDSQVTTAKIADANITAAKLASNAVETAKIADANITAAKLASNAVETAKINNAAVTAAKLDGAQTGSAPIFGCRAWVAFDGTRNEADSGASTNGANVKIFAGGNVSSVLKNAAGDYTITFTTAMPDANYCVTANAGPDSSNVRSMVVTVGQTNTNTYVAPTTSAVRIGTRYGAGNDSYDVRASVAIFR